MEKFPIETKRYNRPTKIAKTNIQKRQQATDTLEEKIRTSHGKRLTKSQALKKDAGLK